MPTFRAIYEPLPEALGALQDVLRLSGLQHLACIVPVQPVQTDLDFVRVKEKLATIHKLLELKPPELKVRVRVAASLKRVDTLIQAIESAVQQLG